MSAYSIITTSMFGCVNYSIEYEGFLIVTFNSYMEAFECMESMKAQDAFFGE